MQKWLRINGTDFNVEVCALLSLEEFKEEGQHSFAKGKSNSEIEKIYSQIVSVGKPAPLQVKTKSDNGNSTGSEKKVDGVAGKGSVARSAGDTKKP